MLSTEYPSHAASSLSDGSSSSATGLLALLEEGDTVFQIYALKKLHGIVDYFWAEVADSVGTIEALSEDENFPERELAASVASKVFYHLDEMHEALRLALSAGSYFDINAKTQYVETLIAKSIDEYSTLYRSAVEKNEIPEIDSRLIEVVNRMYQRCYEDGQYRQALGVALQAWNLSKIEEVITNCPDKKDLLKYCSQIAHTVIPSRLFRMKVLGIIVKLYGTLPSPDYIDLAQCFQHLDEADATAEMLDQLIRGDADMELVAFQVAFDAVDTENQQFLVDIIQKLPAIKEESPEPSTSTEETEEAGTVAETESNSNKIVGLETPEYQSKLNKVLGVLRGDTSIEMQLHFLWSHNKSDLAGLRKIKGLLESRNSVTHNATVACHGFTNAGTTVDTFLRENLAWLSKATNWAKFSATASLGVIHRGHMKESKKVLAPYLPATGSNNPSGGGAYSEGGALYALGLIHANKGSAHNGEIIEYLLNSCRNTTEESTQYGAIIGLSLAAMAVGDSPLYEELKNILYTEQAVQGEAAGLGIGLLFLGRGNAEEAGLSVPELLAYAHETKHEKIIRGISLGIAMVLYGKEDEADGVIEQMTRDLDPIIRYGGMFTIALAYAGTGNNKAIRRLLHVAVSDVSNDVRRAAVMALGFLLFRTPEQVPKLVKLLSESYNPHVRYGACLAVGIACAGTSNAEGLKLVKGMLEDSTDFVRQGAMMACAMILMQQSPEANEDVKELQEKFYSIMGDKHQFTMTKMGAILASGFLNAGGRNVSISMVSGSGIMKMGSVVGLMLGLQYWYWYPLVHLFSLSFTPTVAMGLDKNLQMPKSFKFHCDTAPSVFAYPAPIVEKLDAKKSRVETAVLSTTAKIKQKERRKKKSEDESMDVEVENVKEEGESSKSDSVTNSKTSEKKKEPEPKSFDMSNPSRCTPSQVSHVSVSLDQRFVPIVPTLSSGIIILKDQTPDAGDYVTVNLKAPLDGGEGSEPDPPETFIWTP